nr:hypothetical protein [Tanacetum cinerariifolium]
DTGAQAEGQTGSNPDETSKGQAGSNPDETSEGQVGPDPGNAEAKVQSISSPMVHAGLDHEHMDIDVANRIGELEHTLANLIQVNKTIEERLDKHGARLYTLEQLDIPQQVSIAVSEVVTDAVDWAMQVPLCNRFKDLLEADMKEILHQRMWETDSYKSYEKKRKKCRELPKMPPGSPSHQPPHPPPPAGPSGMSGAPRASRSQVTPPPPPPTSTNQDSPSTGSAAPSLVKTAATTKHQAWSTPDELMQDLAEARKKKKKSREPSKTPPGSPSHQLPPPPLPAGPSEALGAPRASGSAQMPPSPPPPLSTNQESPSKGFAAPSPSKTAASAEYQA